MWSCVQNCLNFDQRKKSMQQEKLKIFLVEFAFLKLFVASEARGFLGVCHQQFEQVFWHGNMTKHFYIILILQ